MVKKEENKKRTRIEKRKKKEQLHFHIRQDFQYRCNALLLHFPFFIISNF